jgi:hypothetical protein
MLTRWAGLHGVVGDEGLMVETLLGIVAVTIWLVGGTLIMSRHYRRRGKSYLRDYDPFRLPWRELDGTERRDIAVLALVTFLIGAIAVSL